MSTAEWIGVLVAVVSAAVSVGVSLGKLAAVQRDVDRNARGLKSIGERFDGVKERLTVLETTLRVRRQTGAVLTTIPDERSEEP